MRSMVEIAKGAFLTALAVALVFSAGMRSILLPFAFALLLARWADRPVSRLAQQLPRWLAALIILTVSGLLLCCILLLLIVKLWQDIPAVLSGAQDGTALWTHLEHFTARLPAFLRGGLEWLLAQLQTQSSALRTHLTEAGTKWAADTAAALPGALFAWGVALLASFYAAADWNRSAPTAAPGLGGDDPPSLSQAGPRRYGLAPGAGKADVHHLRPAGGGIFPASHSRRLDAGGGHRPG